MDNITHNRKTREIRAEHRLGTRNPICHVCAESTPHCLEHHHISGQAFSPETAHICRNCHRKLSNAQRDHPKMIGREPLPLEQVGHFLLGLADLFELLFRKLNEFGLMLIELAKHHAESSK